MWSLSPTGDLTSSRRPSPMRRLNRHFVPSHLVSPHDLGVGLLDGDHAVFLAGLLGRRNDISSHLAPALFREVEPAVGRKRRASWTNQVVDPRVKHGSG